MTNHGSPPAIAVSGLSVEIGGAVLLHDIDLEVTTGSFVAVVGPNGAGKSTLLRCMDGLIRPSRGAVAVEGRPVSEYRRRELARTVSYVPQSPTRADDYTVRDFVELARYAHLGAWGAFRTTDREAVAAALDRTETGHLAQRTLVSLSGGEFQRVLIAAAVAQGGRVLLLDEPTSFLDYRHQVQVLELLERLHRHDGLTLVVVSHDLSGTVTSADTVLALKAGATVFTGSPSELLREDVLAEVFDARFRCVPGGRRDLPLVVPVGESL